MNRRISTWALIGNCKPVGQESDNHTNRDRCFWYRHLTIFAGTGGLGNKTNGDHLNNYIIKNDKNTEKSPGDLRRLAVTQTPVKAHQLTLMLKSQGANNNIHSGFWNGNKQ